MSNNPYSTPVSESPGTEAAAPGVSQSLTAIAKPTFLAWERLRILYVLLLGIVTIALTGLQFTNLRVAAAILQGAIAANLCFFAGPIIETYVRWLGFETKWLRRFLFVSGTILTAMLAFVALATMLFPEPA